MWKYSRDGNYSTKIAYKLLTEDFLESQQFQQERKIWTTIWKAMFPQGLSILCGNFSMTTYLPRPLHITEELVMKTLAPYVILKKRLLHIYFSYAAYF